MTATAVNLVIAAGRPVVAATGADGATRLVLDAGAGVVVPPERPDAMVGSLLEVLDDRSLADRLGAAGSRYARDQLSRDAAIRRTVEFAATLAGSARRPATLSPVA